MYLKGAPIFVIARRDRAIEEMQAESERISETLGIDAPLFMTKAQRSNRDGNRKLALEAANLQALAGWLPLVIARLEAQEKKSKSKKGKSK